MKRALSSDSIAKTPAVSSDTDATVVDTAATSPRSAAPLPLPQVNTVEPAEHPLLGVGSTAPIGAVESHTLPVIAVRATVSIEPRDHRLDVLDSDVFQANLKRALEVNLDAWKYLVAIYNEGNGDQQRDMREEQWVHKAADHGHAGAQALLGVLCSLGLGVTKDYDSAFKWAQKAAEQGNAVAQALLGVLYLNGLGVAQDDDSASKWTQKAAEQGNVFAQANLGWLYLNGRGVEKNVGSAFKWFQKAAEQGHVAGQAQLGNLYLNGRGVEKNAGSAFKWTQKAAEQGHAFAQSQLGGLYLKGRGVNQDDEIGFKWTQKAATQGQANAQSVLGGLYFLGRGVEKDDKQAAYWKLNAGLSADGLTLSCAKKLPVELVKFLPQLFAETPEWHRVRTLNLSENAIDDDAAVHLALLITENPTLEALDLRDNPIGQNGAASLAVALRSNQTLKALHLDPEASTAAARADIARALVNNQNITALREEVEKDPIKNTDELPIDVLNLIEQAMIVADQKTDDGKRTLEQTQAVLKELRLSVAQQFITG